MIILLTCWIITTIFGTYWLIKHPSQINGEDMEYYTFGDIIHHLIVSSFMAWVFVPIGLFESIKFKR